VAGIGRQPKTFTPPKSDAAAAILESCRGCPHTSSPAIFAANRSSLSYEITWCCRAQMEAEAAAKDRATAPE
jgi:hypothetical protein